MTTRPPQPTTTERGYGYDHQQLRTWYDQQIQDGQPITCVRCGQRIQPRTPWHLGHNDQRQHHGPEHADCNLRDAQRKAAATKKIRNTQRKTGNKNPENDGAIFETHTDTQTASQGSFFPPDEREGPVLPVVGAGPEDSLWDAAGWLDDLRVVPGDATWPRFMSAPHPRAVGSYGVEFEEWVGSWEAGGPLRWWQRLVARRVLEHDAEGELVWLTLLLTLARQCGKSWLVRGISMWRIHQKDRFGEEQLALYTAKDAAVCREAQRPARVWARHRPESFKVREANAQEEIEFLGDGSRWLVRTKFSVYGYSASLGVLDEAWAVQRAIVEDGLEPTMAERSNPQLWLVSTANRRATSLMPGRREEALLVLAEPDDLLIMEWSRLPGLELDDREGWRQASPHWTPQRERLVASKLRSALSGVSDDPTEPDPIEAFKAQWLNEWPSLRGARREPWLPDQAWMGLAKLPVPASGHDVVLAVEGTYLRRVDVVGAAVGGGVFHVWSGEQPTDEELGQVLREAAGRADPDSDRVLPDGMGPWEVLEVVRSKRFRKTLFGELAHEMPISDWGGVEEDASAAGDFYRGIVHDHTVMHDHHALIGAHMRNVDGHIGSDRTLRLKRPDSGDPADAAIAALHAWWRALQWADTAPSSTPVIY